MADQPIDPGLLDAWIRDMRAQLNRIDKALQPPAERPNAPGRTLFGGVGGKRPARP